MNALRQALKDYVSMRRGLGHKFVKPENRLGGFLMFMEQRKADVITSELAIQWATRSPGVLLGFLGI